MDLGEAVFQRVEDLKMPFAEEANFTSPHAAIAMLRKKYLWDAFLQKTIDFYSYRKASLDKLIKASGGIPKIMKLLGAEVKRRADAREADFKRQGLGQIEGTPGKAFGRGAIAAIKKRLSEQRAVVHAAPVAPMAADPQTLSCRTT